MKQDNYDESGIELHGAIQVLLDYSAMHIIKRNQVHSMEKYATGFIDKQFNEIESLRRIRKQAQKVIDLIGNYKI